MSDYPLERLTPRSFEHVVQALVVKSFGISALIWGDEPDGGREATVEGPITLPESAVPLHGYLVVQAKFLQRPHSSTAAQARWALAQLREELSKYDNPNSRRRKPDAYLFVTNCILPPALGAGKDRILQELERFRARHGLQFVTVWDYDQLGALLDNAADIRTRYAELVASGDILQSALSVLRTRQAGSDSLILTVLQRQIVEDTNPRLAADAIPGAPQVSLADSFVDLTARPPSTDRYETESAQDVQSLAHLLSVSVDPEQRLVILGGPGQGKTTLTQFLAQINRVALLSAYEEVRLSPVVKSLIAAIKNAMARLNQSFPAQPRFPLRLDAPTIARLLEQAEPASRSMWHVLGVLYSETSRVSIAVDVLRAWVQLYPCILMVDSYDEVSIAERMAVLTAITDFIDECQAASANLQVVVTSRPQAYLNDLKQYGFVAWSLRDWGKPEARQFAARLLAGVETGPSLLNQFEESLDVQAVRVLASTPLHVVLLVTLLQEDESLPRARHALFHRYYEHVYLRERGRGGILGETLSHYKYIVDLIHARTAFALQVSRKGPTAASSLDLDLFRQLVQKCVTESGVSDNGVSQGSLIESLITLARDRLVLLVGVESDSIGFQIRSLQEFLAADFLWRADERLIRDRMRAAALSPDWDGVTRFMASRAFTSSDRDLRDTVVLVTQELDDPKFVGGESLRQRGAQLAIDTLADGAVAPGDHYVKHLWPEAGRLPFDWSGQAQSLVDMAELLPDEAWLDSLANNIRGHLDDWRWDVRTAWSILLGFSRRGSTRALGLVNEILQQSTPRRLAWLLSGLRTNDIGVLCPQLPALLSRADASSSTIHAAAPVCEGAPRWVESALRILCGDSNGRREHYLRHTEVAWPLSDTLSLESTKWIGELLEMPSNHYEAWEPWLALAAFLASPDSHLLAVAANALREFREWLHVVLPWPVKEAMADPVFGRIDLDAWHAAEQRWASADITIDDVGAYLEHGSLVPEVANRGFPFAALGWTNPGQYISGVELLFSELWNIWSHSVSPRRAIITRALIISSFVVP